MLSVISHLHYHKFILSNMILESEKAILKRNVSSLILTRLQVLGTSFPELIPVTVVSQARGLISQPQSITALCKLYHSVIEAHVCEQCAEFLPDGGMTLGKMRLCTAYSRELDDRHCLFLADHTAHDLMPSYCLTLYIVAKRYILQQVSQQVNRKSL